MKRFLFGLILFAGTILADDVKWVMKPDSDMKMVLLLDQIPGEFMLEFWFNGQTQTMTKESLILAIESFANTKFDSKVPCKIDSKGQILNYPCRVVRTPVKR